MIAGKQKHLYSKAEQNLFELFEAGLPQMIKLSIEKAAHADGVGYREYIDKHKDEALRPTVVVLAAYAALIGMIIQVTNSSPGQAKETIDHMLRQCFDATMATRPGEEPDEAWMCDECQGHPVH